MKVSNILSYVTFCLVLVFSTTLFAAQKESVVAPKVAKLPSVIKINPADLPNPFDFNLNLNIATVKNDVEKIHEWSDGINHNINVYDQKITQLRTKMNECRQKSFTAEDQKNAGCTDNMTVAACSQLLFKKCISKELADALDSIEIMDNLTGSIENYAKELIKANADNNSLLNGLKK